MRWFEKPEVLDHIIESYAGIDGRKRQFIWEELSGDTVIGNSRAFADHLRAKFGIAELGDKSWMAVHEALRALGEVAQVHAPHRAVHGRKFINQRPEVHVIKRGGKA
jgi:hypothetical protein